MKRKILIIDDEKATRDTIELLLKANNYEVTSASDGVEGIQKINEDEPDLILCDIVMPRKNGYEVFNATDNKTPFIFLTAKTDLTDFREGMSLGADDYIMKPFHIDDLLRAIKVRLQKFDNLKKQIGIGSESSNKYSYNSRILFKRNNNLVPVLVKSIVHISAERQYSCVFTEKGQKFFVKKSLTQWEKELPANMIIRIHRSSMVNIRYIKDIKKGIGTTHYLHLHGSDRILNISRRFYKNLHNII